MDPSLARRVLVASTEITSAALEDPENVLRLVVEAAAEIADADLGLAMLATEDDDGTLTVEASSAASRSCATLSPRSAAAKAARTGVPVMADDVTNDPRTAPYVPQPLRNYGPFAVAPFGTSDRKIGALAVYRAPGQAAVHAGDGGRAGGVRGAGRPRASCWPRASPHGSASRSTRSANGSPATCTT